jgi:hypothetical protein
MKAITALEGGLAGATALTVLHEATRKVVPKAPRMELLGMQALSRLKKETPKSKKQYDSLYGQALVADIITNTLFFSLVGIGKKKGAGLRGGLLGAAAGLTGLLLPRKLGMYSGASNRTGATKLMTVALYTIGGVVAAGVMCGLNKLSEKKEMKKQEEQLEKMPHGPLSSVNF